MNFLSPAAAMYVPGFLRVGGLRVPVYGLFAAVGLIAALWLSQRTARIVGLSAEKLWDAGVFAVIAAFVASRVLLVVFELKAFVRFPLLVLALPSLTYGGMLLTGVMVWVYLRWKGLPWRDVADAWAPCGAVLAAVLSVGHFVEGTEAGMPTSMPWGVHAAGDTVLGKTHPVQLYEAVLAMGLCAGLLWRLQQGESKSSELRGFERRGKTAAVALMVGGVLEFLLDMLRQPVESNGSAWLDPGQFVALAAMVGGGVLWAIYSPAYVTKAPPTREQVATFLEVCFDGRSGKPGLHDSGEDIEYGQFKDPLLLELKARWIDLWIGASEGPNREECKALLIDYAKRLRDAPADMNELRG